MNLNKYFLIALISCFSVVFVSCDKDELPPSMAELNIEKLQSYHAASISVIGERNWVYWSEGLSDRIPLSDRYIR